MQELLKEQNHKLKGLIKDYELLMYDCLGYDVRFDPKWQLIKSEIAALEKQIAEAKETITEGIKDINFIKWYSGMEEQKIRNAFERYKKEISFGKEECLHKSITVIFDIKQCADCGKPINKI